MYLQITTKCNMTCSHCCYSCNKNGKHADFNTIIDAIAFARDCDESISIGGGEPTLHPDFFRILKHCIEEPFIDKVILGVNTLAQLQENITSLTTAECLPLNDFEFEESILIPSKWPK